MLISLCTSHCAACSEIRKRVRLLLSLRSLQCSRGDDHKIDRGKCPKRGVVLGIQRRQVVAIHSVILTGWGWAADETCAGRGPVGRAVSVVQVGRE